jgi:hypothetical protein
MGVATQAQDPNNIPGLTSVPSAPSTGSTGGGILKYPEDMKDTQDRIKFVTYEVKKGGTIGKGTLSGSSKDEDLVTIVGETVVLPIQPSISDQNTANWGGGELNELQRIAADASLTFMNQGPNAVANQFESAFNKMFSSSGQLSTFGKDFKTFGQLALVEQAVGVNGLLSRATGSVLNPNLELLFQGPTLRPFNFSFKLSPRSQKEADNVKAIIKYFKKNMAVKKVSGSLFLKAPYVFGIEYQNGANKLHQSINKIKKCALQSCSVDYTPLGSYMTYQDSDATMVSYNLSLQFQEIIPIYDTDYDDHPIGY